MKRKTRNEILKLTKSIPGWFFNEDILTFFAIGEFFQQSGTTGDILEIGVYKGKSAFVLNSLIQKNEKLFLCDIFNEQTTKKNKEEINNSYSSYNLQELNNLFQKNFEHQPIILNNNSVNLPFVVGDRKFRFIHVDGSHEFSIVREDIKNVCEWALAPNGIVVFDDYRSPHSIGVTAAVFEAILKKKLKPIFRTEAKLYCTLYGNSDIDLNNVSKFLISEGLSTKDEEFLEFQIKFIFPTKQPYEYYPIIQQLTPPKIYKYFYRLAWLIKTLTFLKSKLQKYRYFVRG
jgi:hypothetical protein